MRIRLIIGCILVRVFSPWPVACLIARSTNLSAKRRASGLIWVNISTVVPKMEVTVKDIPTISSLPATATTAATSLSPASTTSVGDGDEDVDVDPVIGSRYGADTALTHPRPRITQGNLRQSVPKSHSSHNHPSHPSRYLSRSPPIAHSRPPHNEIRQRSGSRSPSPPIHQHGYRIYIWAP
ncbi:hypothetical protein DFH05DRAFT_297046 [Lentinula detonsa]|uniref:Secreted protein n=1 Tax=Lentinula detonsa TaxID=2804962 RepID=A0A9W8NWL4_9AGAR|nr:hypothetical protein DFH05DRAFT_297046 [Lentinula detonsa]